MFCVWIFNMMWCVPMHRNVQDICMQCFADKVMRMMWCAMSHTFEHRGCKPLHAPCSEWDQPTTPVKDATRKPPTSCRATESMRMMWCVGSQGSVSQLTSYFMILSGYKPNRSRSCRAEHRTAQRVSKPFYIIHCSFVLLLFVLSYCALL